MIEEGRFYRVKDEIDGMKPPEGYLFTTAVSRKEVRFMLADVPDVMDLVGGSTFTTTPEGFRHFAKVD